MKPLFLLAPFIILFACCGNKNTPDVSNIPVDIKIERFDKFVFNDLDTNNIVRSMALMQSAYPFFANDFLVNILGLPSINTAGSDTAIFTFNEVKRFLQLTRPVYDSIAPAYKDVSDLEKDLSKAFRYVKYYFPAYKIPKVVTYIGPFNAPGVAVTNEALAIGLQLFAGKEFSFYTSTDGQESYPMYISRRFERQYILPNCMKAVIEDIYPDQSAGKSLIEQMIEKGKRWYLLDNFLPDAPDSLKTDYTAAQLKWTESNEGLIWNFILQGTDIYTTDPALIKNYIGEAPSTNGMPEVSPGNIGQWIGWQIVKAYTDKHSGMLPDQLMKEDAKKIFTEARYKPR